MSAYKNMKHNKISNSKYNTELFSELPREGFETCIICGTNSKGYAFCKKCYREYDDEYELLEILNTHARGLEDQYDLDVVEEKEVDEDKVITIDFDNKNKCITCGKDSNGFLFCKKCFKKYQNRKITLSIDECKKIEILDEYYSGRYIASDGHIVKSKSELLIDDYLFEHNIKHCYEVPFYYSGSEKDVLHPDFKLPGFIDGKDVYIEHWGYDTNGDLLCKKKSMTKQEFKKTKAYKKTKDFKMPIYKEKGITLICTYESDINNIRYALDRKLSNIKVGKINDEKSDDNN